MDKTYGSERSILLSDEARLAANLTPAEEEAIERLCFYHATAGREALKDHLRPEVSPFADSDADMSNAENTDMAVVAVVATLFGQWTPRGS